MHILTRTLRDRRVSLSWWIFGLVAYTGMIVAFWPMIDGNTEFGTLYADMPDAFQAMFGSDGLADFTSPVGFMNTYLYSLFFPFILTGLAVAMGSTLLAGEEQDGLLELVLSHPVRRRRLLSEKIAAMVVSVLVAGSVTVVFLAVLREPVGLDIGVGGLVAATLGSALFAILSGLVAFVAGAVGVNRGAATGLGWGVAIVGYLLNVLASLDASMESLQWASPLYWATADNPVAGHVPATYLILGGAALALIAAALAIFERHDLT